MMTRKESELKGRPLFFLVAVIMLLVTVQGALATYGWTNLNDSLIAWSSPIVSSDGQTFVISDGPSSGTNVFRSTDKGATMSVVNDTVGLWPRASYSDNLEYIYSRQQGTNYLIRSQDQGATWEDLSAAYPYVFLYTDSNSSGGCLAVSRYQDLQLSTDYGASFSTIYTSTYPDSRISRVYVADDCQNIAFVVTNYSGGDIIASAVYYSSDAGANWNTNINMSAQTALLSASNDGSIMWILSCDEFGGNCAMRKSTDYGASFSLVSMPGVDVNNAGSLKCDYDCSVVLYIEYNATSVTTSMFYVSSDGGDTWTYQGEFGGIYFNTGTSFDGSMFYVSNYAAEGYFWRGEYSPIDPATSSSYYNFENDVVDRYGLNNLTNNGASFSSSQYPNFSVSGNGANYSALFVSSEDDYANSSSFTYTDTHWISMWAKFNSDGGGWPMVLASGSGLAVDARAWNLLVSGSGYPYLAVSSSGSSWACSPTSDTVVSTGIWYHYVGLRNSTGCYLFINGALNASTVSSFGDTYGGSGYFNLGNWNLEYGGFFDLDGYMDEVRVGNTSLTDAQIQNLYDCNDFTCGGPPAPPNATYVTLISPANGSNVTNSSQQFTFSFNSTNSSTLSCDLYVNSTIVATNASVLNNTETSLSNDSYIGSLNGSVDWYAQCGANVSETWMFNANMVPACTPNWTCSGYASCLINDTQYCNAVTDLNTCGENYTGDYSEFSPQACDYCTPSWGCDGYASCLINDTQYCDSVNDSNGCYAQTSLPSDQYAGNYSEFSPNACDYCTPSWFCGGYGVCTEIYPLLNGTQECNAANDTNGCYAQTSLPSDQYAGNLSEFLNQSCVYRSAYTGAPVVSYPTNGLTIYSTSFNVNLSNRSAYEGIFVGIDNQTPVVTSTNTSVLSFPLSGIAEGNRDIWVGAFDLSDNATVYWASVIGVDISLDPEVSSQDCAALTYPNEDDQPSQAVIPANFSVFAPLGFSSPSALVNLTYNASVSYTSSTCNYTVIDSTHRNYTCGVLMHYYYLPGDYDLRVAYVDGSRNASALSVDECAYGALIATRRVVSTVSFPTARPGVSNAVSSLSIPVENTGNVPLSISTTAYDLIGRQNAAVKLPASSFKMGTALGNATQLQNGVQVNLSVVAGLAQTKDLWLWLSMASNQQVQDYYSATPWTIMGTG